MEKFLNIIHKILANKLGKFLFMFTNLVALIFLTFYMFAHVQIVFGLIALFCSASVILLLIDRIKKIKEENKE